MSIWEKNEHQEESVQSPDWLLCRRQVRKDLVTPQAYQVLRNRLIGLASP